AHEGGGPAGEIEFRDDTAADDPLRAARREVEAEHVHARLFLRRAQDLLAVAAPAQRRLDPAVPAPRGDLDPPLAAALDQRDLALRAQVAAHVGREARE